MPLSRQLLLFFAYPCKTFDDVCNDIHAIYITMAKPESVKSFKRRFIALLGLVEYYVIEGKWVLYIWIFSCTVEFSLLVASINQMML